MDAPPKLGQIVRVYGTDCEIVRVRIFGTIDVVSLDGSHAWRISGLRFIRPEATQ